MSENILEKILKNKRKKIDILKKSITANELDTRIQQHNNFIDFKKKIKKNISLNKTSIIAEIKKASPSAGIIIEDYNPIEIANIYQQNKATCLSILTEEDFFIDKFQIPLSKSYGADAILIILAGVTDEKASELYDEALKYDLTVIVEVHTIDEAKRALRFKNAIIGINNRNLKTLITDINTTYEICNLLLNHNEPIIVESGIKTKEEILEIQKKTNIKSFLIGESLLKNLKENSIFSIL